MSELKTRAFASRTSGVVSALVLALLVVGMDMTDRVLDISSFTPGQESPVSVRLPMKGYMRLSFAVPVKVEYELEPFVLRVGELVPDRAAEQYKLLQSTLERRAELRLYRFAGLFFMTFLLAFLLSEALRRSWPGNRRYLRTEIAIYVLLAVVLLGAKPFVALTSLPVFLYPAVAVTMVVAYYRGRRLGVYVTVLVSFLLSAMLEFDVVVLLTYLAQGLAVIPFLKPSRKFRPLMLAGGAATVTGLVSLFALSLALSGSHEIVQITDWRNSVLLSAIAGGLLSGPVAWILALSIRPVLGIVSQSKLNDLQELSHPLLKRLQKQAPGTWEHSRAIANLAEEAASKIDADALLVRVGSYFHDMGKAVNPNLFVENQEMDEDGKPINAHDDLAPDRSASLIVDHVTQGVQILRNNGIPEAVVQFAYMHHGSSLIEFFWNKYLEQARKEGVEKPELTRGYFVYPGIPPQSPETGIMMLADAVEAASRTVTEPTHEKFQRMVNRILFTKLLDGQLDHCGITVENLKIVGHSFVESLFFSRHKRVKYQWQEREDAETEKEAREAREKEQEEAGSSLPPPAPDGELPPGPDGSPPGAVESGQQADAVPSRDDEISVEVSVDEVSDAGQQHPSLPPPEADQTEVTTAPSADEDRKSQPNTSAARDRENRPSEATSRERKSQPNVATPVDDDPDPGPRRKPSSTVPTHTLPGIGSLPPDDD